MFTIARFISRVKKLVRKPSPVFISSTIFFSKYVGYTSFSQLSEIENVFLQNELFSFETEKEERSYSS
jgi:hypothetical protein